MSIIIHVGEEVLLYKRYIIIGLDGICNGPIFT